MRSSQSGLLSLSLALLLGAASCAGPAPEPSPTDTDPAAEVLMAFFAALHEGRFADGAALFGGSYDVLRDANPDFSPEDHEALFERYCTQNGGVCLPVGSIVARGVVDDGTELFTVQFLNEDGTVFGQGACCGEPGTGTRRTEFAYTVRALEGELRVMELPPYVP